MPYLLNLVYLLLILLGLPWLVWQSIRKGKYREGYAEKFFGLVPKRTSKANCQHCLDVAIPSALTLGPSPETGEGSHARTAAKTTCLWLHAVSVGEVNLLAPLLKTIQEKRPEWECVISTTTATGMALAKKKYPKYTVFYCPLDFSWAVENAVRRIRPDVLVLAELELWPNLIRAAKRCGAKVAVINGRLSEHSFRGYCHIRPLVSLLMRQIDVVAVQDETYAERFRVLGARPETVHVTGSMKYDGAQTDRNNPTTRKLAALAGFSDDDVVLLAGSTQEPEEAMVLETFRHLSRQWPKLRLVVVPRHPDRFEAVAKLLESSGIAWQRRTAFEGSGIRGQGSEGVASGQWLVASEEEARNAKGKMQNVNCKLSEFDHKSEIINHKSSNPQSPIPNPQSLSPLPSPLSPRVLLIDVVGELGAWWGTARIAFVGGSMGSRGGQNMIEPAAYGAAVSFGPNTWNFRDIVATMLDRDAAVVVQDAEEFARFVRRCLEEPAYASALGQRARSLVLEQLGATEETVRLLERVCS